MTPEFTCATCRDLLPDYVARTLDASTTASMARHLATCTDCQAELAVWQGIDAALHRRDARLPGDAAAVAGWRALQIQLATVGTLPLADASPSLHEMSNSAMNDTHSNPANTPSAPAPRRTPWVATIAAALIAVLGIAIFAVFAQHGPSKGVATSTPPTATHAPVPANIPIDPKTGLPKTGTITDIVMDGPNDGWAVGYVIADADGNITAYTLHYTNGRWQPIGPSYPHAQLVSISIAAPGDVWAVGAYIAIQKKPDPQGGYMSGTVTTGSLAIHYTDGAWHTVQIPGMFAPGLITMFPSGDGWAFGGSDQNGTNSVLERYHAGTWTPVAMPAAFTYQGIDMFAPNEGWVGNNHDLWHYLNGQWTRTPFSAPGVIDTVSMSGPNDGWAGGFIPIHSAYNEHAVAGNAHAGAPASSIGKSTPFLLHYDGTAWRAVAVPGAITLKNSWIASITMDSATDGWMQAEDNFGAQLVLHYDGQTWSLTTVPSNVQFINSVSGVSPNEAWASAAKIDASGNFSHGIPFVPMLLHYTGGAWQVYTQQ